VSTSCTTPRVSLPVRWSCFCTTSTVRPGLTSFLCLPSIGASLSLLRGSEASGGVSLPSPLGLEERGEDSIPAAFFRPQPELRGARGQSFPPGLPARTMSSRHEQRGGAADGRADRDADGRGFGRGRQGLPVRRAGGRYHWRSSSATR